jgi:quaternary ammonium compound-resistance protein SugE
MAWVYLSVAGILEIVWASAMKHSEGFTKLWPTIISLVGMVASMILLSMAMKTLPLGTAYSVWTGIGAAGAFIFGIVVLGGAGHCRANPGGRADHQRPCPHEAVGQFRLGLSAPVSSRPRRQAAAARSGR